MLSANVTVLNNDWNKIACPLYGIARGQIYVSEPYCIRDFTYCPQYRSSTVDVRIPGVSAELEEVGHAS